jgi:hypothetical protein
VKPGRPTASITIDGQQLNSAEAALARLRVILSLNCHDSAHLICWPKSKFASAAVGSTISIALGPAGLGVSGGGALAAAGALAGGASPGSAVPAVASSASGSPQDVFSGEVTGISQTAAAIEIDAAAATIALSRTRRSQGYLSSSVADIVRDLAGPVSVDEVQGDLQLEAYSVDTRRTAWGHLVDLALLSGCDVSASAGGELRFVPVRSGSADHTYRYGADVLHWNFGTAKPFDALGVAPHGDASSSGSVRWHWLLRDPLGSGAKPSRVVGAFHTRDAADQLQSALEDSAARSGARGTMRMVGDSSVRPGELVEIDGLPGGDPGVLRVLEVRHAFDRNGFITTLKVEGSGSGSGGGLPGGISL